MIPISVCIITRNEAENLEKCLRALTNYPFEIVIADTGSTDNSIEIARQYTDKVYSYDWTGDFSAARNDVIGRATHDIILSVDTDEFLTALDWDSLQRLISENPKSTGAIELLNYFEADGETCCQTCRLDRIFNRNYYHYQNPVHEILTPITPEPPASYNAPVTMDHVGYLCSPEKLAEKARRDMELIQTEIDTQPENPYNYFQMAQSYMLMRDHENALRFFREAMNHNPDPRDDYTHILLCNYGSLLLDEGRLDEAATVLSYHEYFDDNMDYLCLAGLIYLRLGQPLKALPEYVKALTAPKRDAADPRSISYHIGYIYELFGQKETARTHYLNCGDYGPALKALERLSLPDL